MEKGNPSLYRDEIIEIFSNLEPKLPLITIELRARESSPLWIFPSLARRRQLIFVPR